MKNKTTAFLRSKKAQIKMFENVGVLVVFFFLLIIGIIFYYSYQEKSINKQLTELAQAKSFRTAEIIFNLPEISCSYNNARFYSCVDVQKKESFKKYSAENPESYFPLLGFSEIKINDEIIYSYIPETQKEAFTYTLPVVVYDPSKPGSCGDTPLKGTCTPGMLEVKYYG